MSEFQPEETMPHPDAAAQGAPPVQNMAAPPPPPYAQAGTPPLPYPVQPNGQPYPAPQVWSAAPRKKRKVWPWVVGGVGGILVLGIGAVVAVLLIAKASVDAVNPNYDAPPVAAGDVATNGGTLMIADGEVAAFEIDPTWIDQRELFAGAAGFGGDESLVYFGGWSTADLTAGIDVSLVAVMVGDDKLPVVASTLKSGHEDSVNGFVDGLGSGVTGVNVTDAEAATTASGLEGLHSTFTGNLQGLTLAGDLYTFARGKHVVIIQVTSYNGVRDEAAATQILDSLRIEE